MKSKIILSMMLALSIMANAQQVDYSVVSTSEESGIDFTKLTKESDYVCMPQVSRGLKSITWLTYRILAISPKGDVIAYLSYRNNSTNIATLITSSRSLPKLPQIEFLKASV